MLEQGTASLGRLRIPTTLGPWSSVAPPFATSQLPSRLHAACSYVASVESTTSWPGTSRATIGTAPRATTPSQTFASAAWSAASRSVAAFERLHLHRVCPNPRFSSQRRRSRFRRRWTLQLRGNRLADGMEGPRLPAIAVCPGDSFAVVDSVRQLEGASDRALRSGYYDRLYLFDPDGRRWRVETFHRTGSQRRGPFGKLSEIRLVWSAPDSPSLADVADDLCKLVDADADDLYDQFVAHDDLKALLRSASSAAELVAVASSLGGDPA